MSVIECASTVLIRLEGLTFVLRLIVCIYLLLQLMQLEGLNPHGCSFLGMGDENDLDTLEREMRAHAATRTQTQTHTPGLGACVGGVSAVFTEFPSNPLLKCPNLHR